MSYASSLKPMPQTDSIYSLHDASRSFPRRWLMCVFSELSVQSGVSADILSSKRDLAMTCPGFCIKSFNMAYSVRVRFTGFPSALTECETASSVRVPQENVSASVPAFRSRSRAAIRAKSSPVSNGFVM